MDTLICLLIVSVTIVTTYMKYNNKLWLNHVIIYVVNRMENVVVHHVADNHHHSSDVVYCQEQASTLYEHINAYTGTLHVQCYTLPLQILLYHVSVLLVISRPTDIGKISICISTAPNSYCTFA